ncbi:hypothetical protein J4558_26990 [Leptolyngbya sp. 15MV]|nr:hypothetical protein J4558_26990 [Leptolyngbya sp. 15MV]
MSTSFASREIGRSITNRHIPHLVFRVDEALRKQAEVFQALQRVQEEREQRQDPGPGA